MIGLDGLGVLFQPKQCNDLMIPLAGPSCPGRTQGWYGREQHRTDPDATILWQIPIPAYKCSTGYGLSKGDGFCELPSGFCREMLCSHPIILCLLPSPHQHVLLLALEHNLTLKGFR